jgi:hypothetical protein
MWRDRLVAVKVPLLTLKVRKGAFTTLAAVKGSPLRHGASLTVHKGHQQATLCLIDV